MNRLEEEENRIKLLKTLLFYDSNSIYQLAKKAGISQPTTLRHSEIMESERLIKIEQSEEGRRQKTVHLTIKGVMYLMFKGNLEDVELTKAYHAFFNTSDFRGVGFLATPALSVIKKTLEDVKPQINLEYYDEAYGRAAFITTLLTNTYFETINVVKSNPKAKVSPSFITKEYLKINREMLDVWEKRNRDEYRIIQKLNKLVTAAGRYSKANDDVCRPPSLNKN